VRQLAQRVRLIHELAELATTKEIADDPESAFGLMSCCGVIVSVLTVEQCHALLDHALSTRQTDAALIGEKFRPQCARRRLPRWSNVIHRAFTLAQAEEYLKLPRSSLPSPDAAFHVSITIGASG